MRKRQPTLKGIRRIPTSASLLPAIEKAVKQTAARFGVSRSWVRATALAHYFGIDEHVGYQESVSRRAKRKAA